MLTLLPSKAAIESRYTCIWPPGIPRGFDPSAVVTAFFVSELVTVRLRQLHGSVIRP